MPAPPRDEMLLAQLDDIQANVVRGHSWRHARYHFLRIEDAVRFRQALAAALEAFRLANAADFFRPGDEQPDRAVNVAFSHRGFQAMGVERPFLESFPEPFREGMAARADRLGDDGESAPEHWDRWLGTEDVHVLVAFFFEEEVDFAAAWRGFVEGSGGTLSSDGSDEPDLPGTRRLLVEEGDQLFDEHGAVMEHFGFRDGVSQPALADGITEPEGGGWVAEDGSWQPIETGEFLLGHPDMDGFDPLEREAALRALCHNGTYLVFRKIRQHVDLFREFLDTHFDGNERDLAAARMVGRWPDGTPLVVEPKKPRGATSAQTRNDFGYHEDLEGRLCPVGAHIRRINPRDAHPDRKIDPKAVARRRIIRRGFPYGSPSDEEKGLLFVCLNARIDTQFEFLQEAWINRGDFIGEGSRTRDPLVGSNDAEDAPVLLPTGRPRYASLPRFVTTRGGEYFFLPGIRALKDLLAGRFGTRTRPPTPRPPHRVATDPVRHPEHLDVVRLHQTREVEKLRFEGIAFDGNRQLRNWYYVVGYDQVLEVLDDEGRFTVGHNTRRLYELLRDPDRDDQQEFEMQMLLGLPGGDPEKATRLGMLRDALVDGAEGSVPELFAGLGQRFEEAAYQVTKGVIAARGVPHLDVARHLARTVPIQRVLHLYGIALPPRISELQKAWHFRQLLEPDRAWLARLRRVLKEEGAGRSPGLDRGLRFETLDWTFPDPGGDPGIRELGFLSYCAAVELLIDAYDTGELFDIGRLCIRELQRHLGTCVDRAEEEGAPDGTLLAALLRGNSADMPRRDYVARVKLLLLELIVGGIETPAKGITNTIDGLLRHPEAMEEARGAVHHRDPAALDRVIGELLRLDPVAFLLFRDCPDGATLATANGLRIEPGSRVALVLRHAYRDPQAFEDPSAFQPMRERADDPGFGRSHHECVGKEIAMAEIRGVVRALLDEYDLQRVPGSAGEKRERFRLPESLGIKLYRAG